MLHIMQMLYFVLEFHPKFDVTKSNRCKPEQFSLVRNKLRVKT